eukprot:3322542-Prymnesium_polylepis.1
MGHRPSCVLVVSMNFRVSDYYVNRHVALFSRSMAAAQTEPAVARSTDRAALERYAFCRLLGEGD